jgi:glycosyltransferase involved in cell wall biosynthesis
MLKVSIIIPMKNEENNIRLCLDSIAGNSFPKEQYEIICIDNGSTDRTLEVASSYTKNLYQLPDATISALRNYGAQRAQGEYLAFIDSDCAADTSWLQAASMYFGSESMVCFGSTPDIPSDATWVQKTWYLSKQIRSDVQRVEWLESMNLIVKKDVFREVGGFNEKLVTCEDVDLCYRIGRKYQIISDKKIRVVHFGEAKTLGEFFKKEIWRGKGNIRGLKEHGLKIKEIPSIVLPLYYLLLPLVFLVLLLVKGIMVAVISLIMLFAVPPVLISIYITGRMSKYSYIFKASIVYLVYFVARAISLIL